MIVFPVGVIGDAAALVGRDLVLVNDPLQRGAVAEAVFVCLWRDAGEGEELVVDERSLVLAQAHLGDAVVEFFSRFFGFGELVFGLLFVVDVDFGQALADADEGPENFDVALKGCAFRRSAPIPLPSVILSNINSVILSGVSGLACESAHGVERARGPQRLP